MIKTQIILRSFGLHDLQQRLHMITMSRDSDGIISKLNIKQRHRRGDSERVLCKEGPLYIMKHDSLHRDKQQRREGASLSYSTGLSFNA